MTLPYYIAIYPPPATPGGTLTDKVKEVQESCTKRTATPESIVPGDYVVAGCGPAEFPGGAGLWSTTAPSRAR